MIYRTPQTQLRQDVTALLFKLIHQKEVHFIAAVLACCCLFASSITIPERDLVNAVTHIIHQRLHSRNHIAAFRRILADTLETLWYPMLNNPELYLDLFNAPLAQLNDHHQTPATPSEWQLLVAHTR
jgi:hypothetical protein